MFSILFQCGFCCAQGVPRGTHIDQKRFRNSISKKALDMFQKWWFSDLWMWLKCGKYKQHQWFSRFGFGPLLGFILEVFWEPKWRPRPSKSHLRKTSKNDCQNEPKLVPKGVPTWSRNHQKWGLGSTLLQGWLPSGLQTPLGSILERFWDHSGTMFNVFLNLLFVVFACVLEQHVANTDLQNHKESCKNATTNFQARTSLNLCSCHLVLKSSLANVNELSGPC